ncbi:hypothetical protein KGM_214719A, partial [Danaus plexippus plexippus]
MSSPLSSVYYLTSFEPLYNSPYVTYIPKLSQ